MKINLTETQVYYINLPRHTDKNENMKKMFSDLNFTKVQRLDGSIYPENPIAGCSRAHYHSLDPTKVPFILFEDDAFLLDSNWKYDTIDVPDDADAVYLGTSTWGRMNGHNGEYIQYDKVDGYPELVRVYNILATHAILYISKEYTDMCKRVGYHTGYVIENYNDVGFAEIQRYFNVYAFDTPIFAQSSNIIGTNKSISSINHTECMQHNSLQFYPYKIK
jgi:hypothetical protein